MTSICLGIEKSLSKGRWVSPDIDLGDIEKLARAFDIPEVIARLLLSRDIAKDDIPGFLNPTLKEHFPDPFSLIGMEAMAEDLASAIQAQKQIAIFGDFDVDGATSSAILFRFLRQCGIEAQIYIPDRLSEGYGPNLEALRALKDNGAEIVMMLDCGTTAFEIVKQGTALGLEITILDHHEAEEALPDAKHVINPKRKDDHSGLDMLAACGVTFLACVAINAKLRSAGFYKDKNFDEPNLKSLIDVLALGTVCDMVPLLGANRLFVRHGFEAMNHTQNEGLNALINVCKIKPPMTPYHAGFVFGPRINAGSRVHKADLGARLLSTRDQEEALNIAWTLNDCNDKRKAIQLQMEREAKQMVDDKGLDQHAVIMVGHEDWHPGLSGLVAGALKELYKKPACVITYAQDLDGNREGRGSGRSVPGIHIAQAFIDARNDGLITKGGGHAMAGGFTVLPDQLEAFTAFMQDHIAKQAANSEANIETEVDAVLSVSGANPKLVKLVQSQIGPFGQGFEEPLFALSNVRLHMVDVVGESHIRMMVSDWEGGARMKAMAFRAVGTELGDALLKHKNKAFHLVGSLKIDNWSGHEKVEMHVKDAAFVLSDAQFDVEQERAHA